VYDGQQEELLLKISDKLRIRSGILKADDPALPVIWEKLRPVDPIRLLSFLTTPERSKILISEGRMGIQGKIGCVIGAG